VTTILERRTQFHRSVLAGLSQALIPG
jgi:hypothetical protein